MYHSEYGTAASFAAWALLWWSCLIRTIERQRGVLYLGHVHWHPQDLLYVCDTGTYHRLDLADPICYLQLSHFLCKVMSH